MSLESRNGRHEGIEGGLRAALKRDCPPPHLLGEYHMDLLPAADAEAVRGHLKACPPCAAELAQLTLFLAEAEQPSLLEELREIVVEWGRQLVQPRPGLALGVRGAAARAQTFTAAHLWLAITVQEDGDGRRNLLALVTREDGYPLEHGTAWLSQGNKAVLGGQIDEAGNLVISGIEPGEYDLGIQADSTRVWVRGVSV